jgi:allophanate hydrolase subunit 1
MFDARRDPPTIVEPGDTIRFVPISEAEYEKMVARSG